MKRIYSVTVLILAGIYSWPLLLRSPSTFRALFAAFNSRAGADGAFYAFGPTDAGFRPWYTKIANDYHNQGRFGYVWDDGLGMPLGPRIYNNLATYLLLYRLGTRRMSASGYLLMGGAVACVLLFNFQLCYALPALVILLASPLLVGAYTHLGKPETFWWGPAVILVYAVFAGAGLWAGLLWSLIAMVNVSIAVMVVFLMGPFVITSFSFPMLGLLIAGALPGGVKLGLRGLYMLRSGFLSSVSREQSRLWKRPWYPVLLDVIWWVPFTTSIALSGYALGQPVTTTVLLVSCIGLYWINFRVIYLNDAQSFHLAFLAIGGCYAASGHSVPALMPLLLMTYVRPDYCGFPQVCGEDLSNGDTWQRRLQKISLQLKRYPNLQPITHLGPPALTAFFGIIPEGSRILLESDGDPRTVSRFRPLEQWMESFLPPRQIDLVNEIYTNMVEPDLVEHYLNRFNSAGMTPVQMHELTLQLGVSHVVAFSAETVRALQSVGFRSLAEVDPGEDATFAAIVPTPAVTLTLLEAPDKVTVVAPYASWSRRGNELSWEATAGVPYLVKYRFDSAFIALQNAVELKVEPASEIEGISLRFMRVKAAQDGPVVLRYVPRYL